MSGRNWVLWNSLWIALKFIQHGQNLRNTIASYIFIKRVRKQRRQMYVTSGLFVWIKKNNSGWKDNHVVPVAFYAKNHHFSKTKHNNNLLHFSTVYSPFHIQVSSPRLQILETLQKYLSSGIYFSLANWCLQLSFQFIYSWVGIATGYRLGDRGVGVRVPVGSRIFFP
jgi:hypothetical protein